MFETLYRYSRVLARHLEGPAAEERDRFVTHCVEAGAARESVFRLASELLLVAQRLDIDGTRAFTLEVRISAIVDARFSLIVDGETASSWTRWGSAQAPG